MGESSIVTEKSRMLYGRAVVIAGARERNQGGESVGVRVVVHRRRDVHGGHLELSVLVHGGSGGQCRIDQDPSGPHDRRSVFPGGIAV